MRYGVIADIHANLPALRSALAILRKSGVDSYLCLGDLVGYGPSPNEVIEQIAELEIPCVLGNHDEVVVTGKGWDRVNDLARQTLEWTQEHISDSASAYLSDLPLRREAEGGVLMTHGSITDPWTYVRRREDAQSELDRLDEYGSAVILLAGHTHRPMMVTSGRGASATSEGVLARRRRTVDLSAGTFLNPGAVGQSREWRRLARFALVDVDARRASLLATSYAYDETEAALRRSGLPAHACHARPRLKKVARQVVRDYEDRKMR